MINEFFSHLHSDYNPKTDNEHTHRTHLENFLREFCDSTNPDIAVRQKIKGENLKTPDFSQYIVKKGDLLIAISGATTGKVGVYLMNEEAMLNQRVGKFKPKSVLDKNFLFKFLSTKVEENLKISVGSAQPNLSTEQINNFKIPFPPLEEQKQITAKLDALQEKTQTLEKIYCEKITALQSLKQSLLNQAFQGELTKD